MTRGTPNSDERYTVISADCHGGADIAGYKPYLEARWHDEFDAWAAEYEIPYDDMTGPDGNRNWDSQRRLRELEDDGIVAEVIYPNTVPPFFPKVSFAAQPPPLSSSDADRRAAGLRAANRWLADFCADAPGRRAGIAQVSLTDIDASVRELHWAKENGLTGGLLLPGTPPGGDLTPLWHYDHYAPIWRTCEELGLPVNHHSGSAVPVFGDTDVDRIMFLLEVTWWAHRAFTHLVFSGTLDKHPGLQLVLTEQGTAWIPQELFRLDYFYDRMLNAVGSQEHVWGFPIVSHLDLKPSEYWARQCQVGSSFIRPEEVPLRSMVGVDKIMWGSDYPHKEMSYPFSREAIRLSMADVDRAEIAMMLGGNAARVYGFDLDVLDKVAAEVGPAVEEIARPLTVGEVPVEADRCPAFVGHVGR